MCFLLQKELERTHFLWNWCWAVEKRSNACMFFPFCKLSRRAAEAAQRQTLSGPPPLPLPPAGLSQLRPRPCSYCWGKQKTTAMRHQTGLHHVYTMTEAWASLQRGGGPCGSSDSPSTSKAVLRRPRGLKGPWRSLPPSLSFHQEA